MSRDQKGVISLPAVIVIVLAIGVGAFLLGRMSFNNTSPSASIAPVVSPSMYPSNSDASVSAKVSPAPSSKETATNVKADVEVKQNGNQKVYINHKKGFSFSFANSMSLNTSSNEKLAQFLEHQDGTGNVARMVLQIFENPQNLSLEDVIKQQNLLAYNPLGPKYEYLTIKGKKAVKLTKVMTQNELCNDSDGTTKNRVFYFLVVGDGYVVAINPNESCETFKKDWFALTINSFTFL